MEKKDDLGDRMKGYESCSRAALTNNLPIILRVDGRSFHSFTRGMSKPFDDMLMEMMDEVAVSLVGDICNARLAYVQSDEVSVLISKRTKEAQFWFGNEVQKMASIAAGIASSTATAFICNIRFWGRKNKRFGDPLNAGHGFPSFDARVFVLPEYEVPNYFYWRQSDCSRNSVQMLARSLYPHGELQGKSIEQMHDMIHAKGQNWNDLPTRLRRGRCVVRCPLVDGTRAGKTTWVVDNEIPVFTEDRGYITSRVGLEEPEPKV